MIIQCKLLLTARLYVIIISTYTYIYTYKVNLNIMMLSFNRRTKTPLQFIASLFCIPLYFHGRTTPGDVRENGRRAKDFNERPARMMQGASGGDFEWVLEVCFRRCRCCTMMCTVCMYLPVTRWAARGSRRHRTTMTNYYLNHACYYYSKFRFRNYYTRAHKEKGRSRRRR